MEYQLSFASPDEAKKAKTDFEYWAIGKRMCREERIEVLATVEGNTLIPRMPSRLMKAFEYHCRRTYPPNTLQVIFQLPSPTNFFQQLWPSGFFSDVTLRIKDTDFAVHRAVLATISPYFKGLFTYHMSRVIEIDDVDPDTFKKILDIIYGYKVEFANLEGIKTLILARRFLVMGEDAIRSIIESLQFSGAEAKELLFLMGYLYSEGWPYWFLHFFHDQMSNAFSSKEFFALLDPELQEQFLQEYVQSDEEET